MVISLCLVVKNCTNVDYNITVLQFFRITSSDNGCILIFFQLLQKEASENFVTMENAIMCADCFGLWNKYKSLLAKYLR